MSGPLVIQRQVKALRRLCSPGGPNDVHAESELKLPFSAAMFYPLFFVGLIMVGRFVLYEMSNPPLDPVGIVILGIGILYFMVSMFCLMALGAWLFHYLHYLASLLFSAPYRELP